MATTSIWRVNGWLGKVLIYIENPDKTENPDFFEKQDMDGKEAQGLADVIEYAVQQQKTGKTVESEGETVMRQFVSGVNCSPSTARDEMIAVKKRFGKEDGTVAYHGYQSFAPGEATPELAHEIGLALAKKLWGEKYQVLVATHLDRENHLHNHFVVNTVSFVDGIKYHRTEQDYFDMQRESDRLCREYGLSVIENPQRGKSKHYGEWRAEQEGRPTYLSLIKADVDTAIRQSMTERQFFYHLRQMGYDVKVGKDITVRPPNYPRGRKLMRNFGEDYSMENIRRRILAQRRPQREHRPEPFRCRLHGDLKQAKKVTGFRALYFHFSRVSKRMANLDMTWDCKVNRTDELGVLANSLNTMAKRLDIAMKELGSANEQLRKDMEHITELSRQRRDFFAAASHELKTPITILKGQIESMILGIGKYKDTGKVLPETLKEVENMERLVKEILTISKIEMDGLAGKAESVPLPDTLAKVTETLLPLAQERQITVHPQLAGDVTVSGNVSLLEKAIHNILSNAIRHSPEGAEVFIHLTPSSLTVTNTGTSIPEEDLPVLFTPFYRVEKSRNKSTGGSGLGLYLVKTILELHGFQYRLNNTETGVMFTVEF